MKVYLATAGEYSDFRVQAVFANRADAEAYELGDDVMEYEVHQGPVEVRTWHTLRWVAKWPDREEIDGRQIANPHLWKERQNFDSRPRVEHEWTNDPMTGDELRVSGWDINDVYKVFSEQRTQYEATRGERP